MQLWKQAGSISTLCRSQYILDHPPSPNHRAFANRRMQIANQPDIYDYELTEFRRFSTKLILKNLRSTVTLRDGIVARQEVTFKSLVREMQLQKIAKITD